jgi:hypothetical protein
MKRVTKWLIRIVAGLAALLLVTATTTLTTVDHTPYRELPAFKETCARLHQIKPGTPLVFGELRAGFGRAKLTPAVGAELDDPAQGRFRAVPLAGYGARHGQPATGVNQDVWVKAMALAVAGQTGVIVAADALLVPREGRTWPRAGCARPRGCGAKPFILARPIRIRVWAPLKRTQRRLSLRAKC